MIRPFPRENTELPIKATILASLCYRSSIQRQAVPAPMFRLAASLDNIIAVGNACLACCHLEERIAQQGLFPCYLKDWCVERIILGLIYVLFLNLFLFFPHTWKACSLLVQEEVTHFLQCQ